LRLHNARKNAIEIERKGYHEGKMRERSGQGKGENVMVDLKEKRNIYVTCIAAPGSFYDVSTESRIFSWQKQQSKWQTIRHISSTRVDRLEKKSRSQVRS